MADKNVPGNCCEARLAPARDALSTVVNYTEELRRLFDEGETDSMAFEALLSQIGAVAHLGHAQSSPPGEREGVDLARSIARPGRAAIACELTYETEALLELLIDVAGKPPGDASDSQLRQIRGLAIRARELTCAMMSAITDDHEPDEAIAQRAHLGLRDRMA